VKEAIVAYLKALSPYLGIPIGTEWHQEELYRNRQHEPRFKPTDNDLMTLSQQQRLYSDKLDGR
jgi:hypothetical protein